MPQIFNLHTEDRNEAADKEEAEEEEFRQEVKVQTQAPQAPTDLKEEHPIRLQEEQAQGQV